MAELTHTINCDLVSGFVLSLCNICAQGTTGQDGPPGSSGERVRKWILHVLFSFSFFFSSSFYSNHFTFFQYCRGLKDHKEEMENQDRKDQVWVVMHTRTLTQIFAFQRVNTAPRVSVLSTMSFHLFKAFATYCLEVDCCRQKCRKCTQHFGISEAKKFEFKMLLLLFPFHAFLCLQG